VRNEDKIDRASEGKEASGQGNCFFSCFLCLARVVRVGAAISALSQSGECTCKVVGNDGAELDCSGKPH